MDAAKINETVTDGNQAGKLRKYFRKNFELVTGDIIKLVVTPIDGKPAYTFDYTMVKGVGRLVLTLEDKEE